MRPRRGGASCANAGSGCSGCPAARSSFAAGQVESSNASLDHNSRHWRPSGGARQPFCQDVLDERSFYVKMAGPEVFKSAVRSMAEACDRALDGAKLTGSDIDILIPHQANIRIIEATAKHANISMDKVYVNVDRYGNTSSASIPIALDELVEQGTVTEGTTALLVAFGAGFTWASMVVRF